MFEDRMHRRKTAGEIHEQHPATVATKLVERQ
jgi:hypothetical protein